MEESLRSRFFVFRVWIGKNLKSLIEYYKLLTMGQLGDFRGEVFPLIGLFYKLYC